MSLTAFVSPASAQTNRQADHEALRGMLKIAVDAVQERNFERIAPLLHRNFTVITVDNSKFESLDQFRAYWNGLFEGPNRILQGIEIRAEADDLTQFLDADTGVVHGKSTDTYHFADGDVRTMTSRWTATVQKDSTGWKLAKLHFSANVLDNPVLDAVRNRAIRYVLLAFAGGAALGALIVFVLLRTGRAKPSHA